MKNIKRFLLGCFLLLSIAFPQVSYADYETVTSKIEEIYVIDNGTNVFGIRIKLSNPGTDCDEWYIKMSSPVKDEMYSLALSIQAQGKQAKLMKRNSTEDIESSGTICGLHRIYST